MRPRLTAKLEIVIRLTLLLALAVLLQAAAQTPDAHEVPCPACLTYYHNAEGKTNLIEEVGLDRDEADTDDSPEHIANTVSCTS